MKSKLFIILLASVAFGCSEFLEETSQTEIRPSTVSDMEKILESEAYFSGAEAYMFNRGTDIFTDDMQSNALPENTSLLTVKESWRYRFTWDATMFNESGGGEDLTFWSLPYERINRCNLVLEYIDDMDGDEAEREHIKGEAYTLRGFYYFMLTNFFGLPYNYGNPAQNPGVPLKLDSGVTDDRLARNSVAECYERVVTDLRQGVAMMKANREAQSTQVTRLNYLAGYALLARTYLYMENWESAYNYADSVLAEKPDLLDLKASTSNCVYYSTSPDEILWAGAESYSNSSNSAAGYHTGMLHPYTVSMDLAAVYQQDVDNGITDIRGDYGNNADTYGNTFPSTYLKQGRAWNAETSAYDYWIAAVVKGNSGTTTGLTYNGGVRTAEMYLIRAEAAIRLYIETGTRSYAESALQDLNTLREHRFEAGYVVKELSAFASGEELLDLCLRERRRELCGEGNHRWFDLRRTGMPQITHVYVDDSGYETTFTLQQGDSRYALPIPEGIIRRNSNLTQN